MKKEKENDFYYIMALTLTTMGKFLREKGLQEEYAEYSKKEIEKALEEWRKENDNE